MNAFSIAYCDERAPRRDAVLAALRAQGHRMEPCEAPEALAADASVALVGVEDLRGALGSLNRVINAARERQVVLLWEGADSALLLEAMRAGVRDVVADPREIGPAIERARERAAAVPGARRPGKIVAVYSLKGGIGKTFLSTNLAIALRRVSRMRTTALDLSLPCGNMEMYLDLKPPCSIGDLLGVGADLDQAVLARALTRHRSGIDLLAGPRPGSWETLGTQSCAPLLELLAEQSGVVVVDLGAYIDLAHQSVLEAADLVVVPATPLISSISTMPQVRAFLNELGVPNERILPVLNHVAPCNEEGAADVIAKLLGEPARHSIPHAGPQVAGSLNAGMPICHHMPQHPVAQAVEGLARDVLARVGLQAELSETVPAPAPGILQMLIGMLRQKGPLHVRP